jgi:hypothetical protein
VILLDPQVDFQSIRFVLGSIMYSVLFLGSLMSEVLDQECNLGKFNMGAHVSGTHLH